MRARMIDECGHRASLALVLMAVPALAAPRPQQGPHVPAINVILLDDQALSLSPQAELRWNDWPTWQARLSSFLGKLALVAEFQRAMGDDAGSTASLYGLEVSAGLTPERREALIASGLARIHEVTRRPAVILARSSAGKDQLRIVFQDARDYTPAHAAKFVRVLGEISPAVPHRRIATSFGPFNPPPTLVFDPRVSALCAADDAEQAGRPRWGVLEQTYMLPHYVLHLIATLDANVAALGDTFYLDSIPEPGLLAAKAESRTDLYVAGAGINSAAERGQTQVLQMALARAGRDSIVAAIDLHDWKARGLTLDNPQTTTELRTYASMMTRRAAAERKNIVFDVRPDLDPYLSGRTFPKDAADYMIKSPRWKSESQLYAQTIDSIVNGYRDVLPQGRTHGLFHSEGGYAWTRTQSTLGTVELYKVRVGADMARPKIEQIVRAGGDAKIFTGKGDYWSLWNLATKSTAQKLARDTGAIALHDQTWRGHGLPLGRSRFEVYSGSNGTVSHLTLDPTRFYSHGLRQRQQLDTGGVLFDRGNVYILDLSGVVRRKAHRAIAAVDAGGGRGGTYREGQRENIAVGIPMGGEKKKRVSGRDAGLLLFCSDGRAADVGALPLALPRSWEPDTAPGHLFEGGWTFEPAALQGLQKISAGSRNGARCEVVVLPFETGNRLAYLATTAPAEGGADSRPPETPTIAFVPRGGDFQPDLVANNDGTFSWRLRHGVVIDFDHAGLVKALRGPGGENIAFAHSGTKLIAQRTSDGRTITVEYAGDNPVHATIGNSAVCYDHHARRLKEIAGPVGVCALVYDEAGHPAGLQYGECTVRLRFDDRGRLIGLASPALDIGLEYASGRNLMRVSRGRPDDVQWHFGPRERIAGVTRGDSGILWTRNSEGRIIQMTLGAIKPSDGGYEFDPDIVIGTLPSDK